MEKNNDKRKRKRWKNGLIPTNYEEDLDNWVFSVCYLRILHRGAGDQRLCLWSTFREVHFCRCRCLFRRRWAFCPARAAAAEGKSVKLWLGSDNKPKSARPIGSKSVWQKMGRWRFFWNTSLAGRRPEEKTKNEIGWNLTSMALKSLLFLARHV